MKEALFSVVYAANTTLASGATAFLAPWSISYTGMFNRSDFNLASGTFRVSRTGYYEMDVQLMLEVTGTVNPVTAADQAPYIQLLVNGTPFAIRGIGQAGVGPFPTTIVALAFLHRNDQVTLQLVNPVTYGATVTVTASDGLFNTWKAILVDANCCC